MAIARDGYRTSSDGCIKKNDPSFADESSSVSPHPAVTVLREIFQIEKGFKNRFSVVISAAGRDTVTFSVDENPGFRYTRAMSRL
jgi:hypothetical protein